MFNRIIRVTALFVAATIINTCGAIFAFSSTLASAKTVLVLGDSISAAYGLKTETGWVAALQSRLAAEPSKATVVNASVSGDTTANGLARLPALLEKHKPTTVIIALGGNDGLRGGAVVTMKSNLSAMVELAQKAKAKVVIVGLQIPPNFGTSYTSAFEAAFKDVATQYKTSLVPSFLALLGTSLDYFQADRIHPNAAAQPLILQHLWPTIKAAL